MQPQLDVGKYSVIAELGQGGMANVYLAVSRGPGGFKKLVVLKSLRSHAEPDSETMAMFVDEARVAARLSHPHLVQTYEVSEFAGRPVIVMEYVEGQTLANLEHRGKGRIPIALHLRLFLDVLDALHHAHELTDFDGKPLGLIHRDMSPQNVIVAYEGHVKVLDFGIAKFSSSEVQTSRGIVKGKVRYMAPEQMFQSERLDRRADIYSVGVMLWEALAGRSMWEGHTELQVISGLASGQPPRPRTLRSDVPESLDEICMRALARDPKERYGTALDMTRALEAEAERLGADNGTGRQLGELVSELFADVRARTRTAIEERLRGTLATGEAVPPNLIYLGTRLSDESISIEGFNGDPRAHVRRRSRVMAWSAAVLSAATLAGATVLSVTERGGPSPLAPPPPVSAGGFPNPIESATAPIELPSASFSLPSTAVGNPSPSAPPRAEPKRAPHGSAPATPAKELPDASPSSRGPLCDPPYTIDSAGIKRFRRDCIMH